MVRVKTITASNLDNFVLPCYNKKTDHQSYQRSLEWLKKRFAEGMVIKILTPPAKGMIEYIPGEFVWRGINADNFSVIQCLVVRGKNKGQGYGNTLIKHCLRQAKTKGKDGVAVMTSDRPWITNKDIFLDHGFEVVDTAPPKFELLVYKFRKVQNPSFLAGWEKKIARYKQGLTVFTSDQCPHFEFSVKWLTDAANEMNLFSRIVRLKTLRDLKRLSPTPYGVFGVVYKGHLVSYRYMFKCDLLKFIRRFESTGLATPI